MKFTLTFLAFVAAVVASPIAAPAPAAAPAPVAEPEPQGKYANYGTQISFVAR
jgi:hypothetical protein